MLELDGVDNNILISMMPKRFADKMLKKLRKRFHLGMLNMGIAFSVVMSGASSQMTQLIEKLKPKEKQKLLEKSKAEMTNNEYSMIMAIVNHGFSEDVMNAARPKERHPEALRFWKISVREEREVVPILARIEDKLVFSFGIL